MLTAKQQKAYNAFYETTHQTEHLDSKAELLVDLAAAMAMNCAPCTKYYLEQCKKSDITKGEISEVLAKVMAVAAGQKRLQMQEVIETYDLEL
ncbi:conserved hypothetical protein [Candidatus Terasakiella magnetica]|uniref:Carboxymuconolactone decarboxylase-like domain-containing protein n=1 Tax=Candidatus Terasakiella magnetica TaxID=1867952 RepID=A0A1C3RKH9_9PROT|nr:carboxymuconolactone decarboxylase family protein [Candidatus Terasakiella magnetica]SCA57824.1 conserved hypothetical protein [Candidatus Terasakiella magnetica]